MSNQTASSGTASTGGSGGNAEPRKEPRPIHSIRGLFEALTAVDAPTRVSALRAIQAQPQVALAFGVLNGYDVIDILLAQADRRRFTSEWPSWVGTLAIFKDPRVTEFFLTILATADSPQMIFSAARYLAATDMMPLCGRLSPLLLQNENPVRARAVVTLLEHCTPLPKAAQLRMAMLSETGAVPVPRLDQSNTELWLAELAGPFWREAQICLRAQRESAWTTLAILWNKLTGDNQLWLLRWGLEEFAGMVTGVLPDALRSNLDTVRIEALGALAKLRESGVPESISSLAMDFLDDPNPEVREAAVQASPVGPDWRAFLAGETVSSVRRACVPQLMRSEGDTAIPCLIALLRSDDWQLRAAAAQALVRLGLASAEAVKPLVHDQDQRIRVAAVRILLDLRQDSWLAQEFLISHGSADNTSGR